MLTERWRKIESLFQSALARAPADRTAYLKDACESDNTLLYEIHELLAAYERTSDPLDVPAIDEGLRLLERPAWFSAGDRVGRYEILSSLGAGGMGEVYLAEDPELTRNVAIKVLLPAFAADAPRMRRLYREGRTASALNHPNILTVYDIGEIGGRPYLVTEFVQGTTLRARLRGGPLPTEEAVRVITQAAEAVRAAHAAHIVHRDIKPENLMLRPDGLLKVLDFGLAKVFLRTLAETAMTDETAHGKIVGSISYMSPEQVSGRDVDGRTDLWSLGVVLYEMVSGQRPFSGPTPAHVVASILGHDVPPLSSDVPVNVRATVCKALTKDREQRYSSALELIADLHGTTPPAEERRRSSHRLSSRKFRPAGWVVAAAFACAALYPAGVMLLRRDSFTQYERMVPLTNSGDVVTAAISADGRYLAFATDSGQERRLWLRQVSTKSDILRASSQTLTYGAITFAPDNKHLYFLAQKSNGAGELLRLPLIGGDARTVVQDIDGSAPLSPDGEHVAFVRHDPGDGVSRLMLADPDGSRERQLAARSLEQGFMETSVAWSPKGDVIASAVWNLAEGKRQLAIVGTHVSSGKEEQLSTHRWAWVEGLYWIGNELLLTGTKDDSAPASQVFRISLSTGTIVNVTNDAGGYSGLSITLDGSVVSVQKLQTAAIWILHAGNPMRARQRTPSGSQYFGITWLDDGHLLTRANTGGLPEIWVIAADGESMRTLSDGTAEQRAPRVCGSGTVVFTSVRTGNWKIWRSDLDGRNSRQITTGASTDGSPVCTPDGKWVVYNSDRSGITALWRAPLDGGMPEQLTSEVSWYPEVSPDGKLIACTLLDSGAAGEGVIAVIPITGGAPIRRLAGIPASSRVRWGPRGETLTYVRTEHNVSNLFARGVFDSTQQQLTQFETDQIFAFDWSRDRSRLAIVRGVESRNAVMLPASRKIDGRN